MSLDPRIGMLNSGKFYAFVHGYDKPECMGTLAEVEIALGLRPAPDGNPLPAKKKKSGIRLYQVTVTPLIVTYAGSQVFGQYTVEVYATNATEAITKARQERRAQEGRLGVRASYQAKLPTKHIIEFAVT